MEARVALEELTAGVDHYEAPPFASLRWNESFQLRRPCAPSRSSPTSPGGSWRQRLPPAGPVPGSEGAFAQVSRAVSWRPRRSGLQTSRSSPYITPPSATCHSVMLIHHAPPTAPTWPVGATVPGSCPTPPAVAPACRSPRARCARAGVGSGHRCRPAPGRPRPPGRARAPSRHRTVAGVQPGHEIAARLHLDQVRGAAGPVGHPLQRVDGSAGGDGDPRVELGFVQRDLPRPWSHVHGRRSTGHPSTGVCTRPATVRSRASAAGAGGTCRSVRPWPGLVQVGCDRSVRALPPRIREHNLTLVAAGVAFYAFLALRAALIAFISIYGLVADPNDVTRQVQDIGVGAPAGGPGLPRLPAHVDHQRQPRGRVDHAGHRDRRSRCGARRAAWRR